MTENTIQLGTVTDFKRMVKSFNIDLTNLDNVAIVKSETKSDISKVDNVDFANFLGSLGLTKDDVKIITAEELMSQESKVSSSLNRKYKK